MVYNTDDFIFMESRGKHDNTVGVLEWQTDMVTNCRDVLCGVVI